MKHEIYEIDDPSLPTLPGDKYPTVSGHPIVCFCCVRTCACVFTKCNYGLLAYGDFDVTCTVRSCVQIQIDNLAHYLANMSRGDSPEGKPQGLYC